MSCAPRQIPSVGAILRKATLQKIDFFGQKGVGVDFVDADRPPKNDQKIGLFDCGVIQIVDGRVSKGDIPSRFDEGWRKQSEVFESDMANGDGGWLSGVHDRSFSTIRPLDKT